MTSGSKVCRDLNMTWSFRYVIHESNTQRTTECRV